MQGDFVPRRASPAPFHPAPDSYEHVEAQQSKDEDEAHGEVVQKERVENGLGHAPNRCGHHIGRRRRRQRLGLSGRDRRRLSRSSARAPARPVCLAF
eukprot:6192563-Pleurochrysis_carterae.AAC.1